MLGELFNFPDNTMAIGRLDEKSEGMLMLTTNGKISEWIRSEKIEKEYFVQVDGKITAEAIDKLKNGISITFDKKSYITRPCEVYKLLESPKFPDRVKKIRDRRHGSTSWISITLREGKFRQVRKMTAATGFPTLRLVRVRIGNIELKNLQFGEVKELNLVNIEKINSNQAKK